jgi:Flp pilus assembly protein TadB
MTTRARARRKGGAKKVMSFVFLFHYLRSADKSRDKMQKKTKKTRCYLSTHRKLKKEDSHIYISFLFLVLFYFIIVYLFLLLNLFFFLKISASLAPFPIWQAWSRKTKQNQNKIKPKILKQSFV